MTIEEIKQQLDFLSEKIDLINTNLQFNITTFLAILALAIAITGVALVLLVKNVVNKRVEIELSKKLDELKQSIINEVNYEGKKFSGALVNGWRNSEDYQTLIYWKDGRGFVHLEGVICGGGVNYSPFRLPDILRPNNKIIIPIITYNGIEKATINTDGEVCMDIVNNEYVEFNCKFKSTI